jgi:alkylation response protein AidB-like acyl-CoA dehydrogenase
VTNLETFRRETRAWLAANCPPSMRTPGSEDETVWGGRKAKYDNPEAKLWLDRMGEKGWTCPTWPKAYGGGGLTVDEDRILQQEMRALRARSPLSSFGIWMLGPVLLEYGTEDQKREHLPKIVRGEIRWCQGYSEPGSGSDLASLKTRAEDQGDFYLVNGSKVWTSYADQADWIFCLVRTDPSAPKHEGISFLLFDMASPGVSTSPIRLISGSSPFCETFFDNVKVPKGNLVGKLNDGWTIAKRLLQHERNMISGIGGNTAIGGSASSIDALAKRYVGARRGRIADATIRDKVARHRMNDRAFALTLSRAGELAKQGQADGNLSAMFKYFGTEQNKRKYEVLLETMGAAALGWEGRGFNTKEIGTTRQWLRSKANSIEGGTSEVQLNVIAKRVLGLPD